MAGASEPYQHLPFFYSDLFELGTRQWGAGCEARDCCRLGRAFKKGVIYYLGEERVRGVLLWTCGIKISSARQLIAEQRPLKMTDKAQLRSALLHR